MIWEAGSRLPEPTACLPVLYVDQFDRQPLYAYSRVDILSMNGVIAPKSLNLPSSIFLII